MKSEVKYLHTDEIHNMMSPREIVPYLINVFHPKSVIDIGCGWGTFLKIFYEQGITDITGVDGKWVDKNALQIPEKYFTEVDLESNIGISRKYDMALCLEVAEHLEDTKAAGLVDTLTSVSDIIIFSAAIVNQGGQNHLNEQPVDYWIKKFAVNGYVFHDVLRDVFWSNEKVDWWYSQNMFLVTKNTIDIALFGLNKNIGNPIHEYIHPLLLQKYVNKRRKAEKQLNDLLSGKVSLKQYWEILKKIIANRVLKNE